MKLSKKNTELINKIRDEWLEIAQSGKDITIKDVEQGVTDLYALDNRKKPAIFILNDPFESQYLANLLSKHSSVNYPEFDSQFDDQIDSQIETHILSQIESHTNSQIHSQIHSQIYSQIYSQIHSQIHVYIDSRLGPCSIQVCNFHPFTGGRGQRTTSGIPSRISSLIYLQAQEQYNYGTYPFGGLLLRAGFLAEYEYYIKSGIINLTYKQKQLFIQHINLFKSGVWDMFVFENDCIITKTPKIKRDHKTRLHSLTSKAVEFRSGFGFYAIHGVVFNEELWYNVKDRKLTPEQLLSMKNTDQRFVAMNHYGFENIIDGLDKKLIDKSKYGNELYSVQFDKVELKFLSYPDIDNPAKKRISFVDPILESASDAMAWKHNCTEEEYHKMEILKIWK